MAVEASNVVIRALGSSGSSWLCQMLSSHRTRFYLGPPDRLWNLTYADRESACLVHGKACKLLPKFLKRKPAEGHFLEGLEKITGGRQLVLFNPSPEFEETELTRLERPFVNVLLFRDIRAVANSLMRHQPERFPTAREVIRESLFHRLAAVSSFLDRPDAIVVRYEDLVASPVDELKRIGAFCGTEYDEDALRFWEFDHHMTAGNTGTIDLLRRMQGIEGYDFSRKEFYDETLKQLKNDPTKPVIDLSWKENLGREDLEFLDAAFGRQYEELGYPRSDTGPGYDEEEIRNGLLADLPEFETKNPQWKASQARK